MNEESEPVESDANSSPPVVDDVDVQAIRSVLDDHPVRLAVLFGSQTDGTADASSDVDIAVELDEHVSNYVPVRLDILSDLSIALDRNDVDLALVGDLSPRVGATAFTRGLLLCGSVDRYDTLSSRFMELVDETDSSSSLRERFDNALAAIDRHLGAEA